MKTLIQGRGIIDAMRARGATSRHVDERVRQCLEMVVRDGG
jgi:hypothetical protein